MEYVTNHFLGGDSPYSDGAQQLVEALRHVRIQELAEKRNEMARQLDSDTKRIEELEEKLAENERRRWWDASVEELNLLKPFELEYKFKTLHTSLCNKVMDSNDRASSSSRVPQPN